MSRAEERKGFDTDVRVRLLESDLDDNETAIDALRKEIAATRQVLTGILVAVTVASIMLAINLVVAR
ncbi:MAG: hypothetical protein EKK62_07700 [Acidimicrobiia bacterium]|nr:MAG: hypothetical protein EKK62_07700 [Acidimicrobiia bacterium]